LQEAQARNRQTDRHTDTPRYAANATTTLHTGWAKLNGPRISANNFRCGARIFIIFGRKQGHLIPYMIIIVQNEVALSGE